MKYRRNAPLTDAQVSVIRSILTDHGEPLAKTNPHRRTKRRRRISPSHRRKLLANLRKARRVLNRRRNRR